MKLWTSHSIVTSSLNAEIVFNPTIENVVGISIDSVRCSIPLNNLYYYRLSYKISSIDTPSSFNGSYVYQHVLLENDSSHLKYDKLYKSSLCVPKQTLYDLQFYVTNLDGSPCQPHLNNQLIINYSIITLKDEKKSNGY